jgi:hypothetical protein
MKRILLAAVTGGVAIFIWGFLAHSVLPLGQAGIKMLPNEDAVIEGLRATITEPGLYYYPGIDPAQRANAQATEEWTRKHVAGPTGLILFQPAGSQPASPQQLLLELLGDIFAAFIAAYLLSKTSAPFARMVWLAMLLGIFAWAVVSVRYWNWYGFPPDFTAAAALDHAVGWTLGGIGMAFVLKPRAGAAKA